MSMERRRLRHIFFVVAVAASLLLMAAFVVGDPFADPASGGSAWTIIAIPVVIALAMASAIAWIVTAKRR